ncbi:hypothetical protein V5799_020840 [Amblyomma americanum]|uniref:Uncharacterized protein n=1 Tax=Amblyomma americanum TaxID=6943 RepID=A0AAQ4ESS0_AMBAM
MYSSCNTFDERRTGLTSSRRLSLHQGKGSRNHEFTLQDWLTYVGWRLRAVASWWSCKEPNGAVMESSDSNT